MKWVFLIGLVFLSEITRAEILPIGEGSLYYGVRPADQNQVEMTKQTLDSNDCYLNNNGSSEFTKLETADVRSDGRLHFLETTGFGFAFSIRLTPDGEIGFARTGRAPYEKVYFLTAHHDELRVTDDEFSLLCIPKSQIAEQTHWYK